MGSENKSKIRKNQLTNDNTDSFLPSSKRKKNNNNNDDDDIDSLTKRRKNENINDDDDKLQKAISNFFTVIEKYIIANLNKIFKIETKNFNVLKNYCLSQPTLIFNAIDYIYPHIKNNSYKNNKEEIQTYINALEKGFHENTEIIKFLNKHSKNILILIEKPAIYNAFYKMLLVLLLDLFNYHGILDLESERELNLKKLITKEYLYRNKKN